jgi:hypothetical protein
MDAATLRELQAPLKQLYRDDPLNARTPLEAEASFETDGVAALVQTWAGTLGISRDVPIGVREIGIVAELPTDADDATLVKLAELTERYCVVGQSLAQVPSIAIRRRTAP